MRPFDIDTEYGFETATSPEMVELFSKISIVQKELRTLNKKAKELRRKCVHKFVPRDEYDPTDRWFSSDCRCLNCGLGGGWYCPKSPDGACEYDEKNDPCWDGCIHCGMPDERK